ncbi:tRNA (N6-isopentenyl adenosine(37)-C2)-methylthiotransferase MiaB [Candidatus Neomarinimicrobiota bacterium]
MPSKYYVETYGCQMNVADSELVAGLLNDNGYTRTSRLEQADIILLNTCAIRDKAEETVHNRLDQLAHLKREDPSRLIGVLGCMAKNLADSLLESKPYVDLILGPDGYRRLPDLINKRKTEQSHLVDTTLSRIEVYDELFPSRSDGVNAWISIMRGCDKFCTFCVVPFTRGRERSRAVESIVEEAREAVSSGFREITLLGQNVNSFSHAGLDFADLLEDVAQVKGLERIRYTSPHPSDIDKKLLAVMARFDNICNSIHLPLQAGADRILNRMNRTYTSDQFLTLVGKIREYLPDCSLSTDIIVGFPGETEGEFQATLDVIKEVKFDSAFMFKYSLRPGTKAAEYSDQVEETAKQDRLERLIKMQKAIALDLNRAYIGQQVEVLIEKESKKSASQWAGRTKSNKWVVFDKMNTNINDLVMVEIDNCHGVALQGHVVGKLEEYNAVA